MRRQDCDLDLAFFDRLAIISREPDAHCSELAELYRDDRVAAPRIVFNAAFDRQKSRAARSRLQSGRAASRHRPRLLSRHAPSPSAQRSLISSAGSGQPNGGRWRFSALQSPSSQSSFCSQSGKVVVSNHCAPDARNCVIAFRLKEAPTDFTGFNAMAVRSDERRDNVNSRIFETAHAARNPSGIAARRIKHRPDAQSTQQVGQRRA